MTDAFEKLVSHTDPDRWDENTNGIPDGWEWNHFGNLDQPAWDDYDGDGSSTQTNTLTAPIRTQFPFLQSSRIVT